MEMAMVLQEGSLKITRSHRAEMPVLKEMAWRVIGLRLLRAMSHATGGGMKSNRSV
jgi:hypothetical protein